jgi:tripartite-type tricarboxylate transporter receptor subunit TctC
VGQGDPSGGHQGGVIDKLNKEVRIALADPEIKARLVNLGNEPAPMTSVDFGKLLANETEKLAKVVKFANIKAE